MPEQMPKAFSMSGESRKNGGRAVFRDWLSGMKLDDRWTGLYVYYTDGHPSLMRTWFDRTTGERAFECVDPYWRMPPI